MSLLRSARVWSGPLRPPRQPPAPPPPPPPALPDHRRPATLIGARALPKRNSMMRKGHSPFRVKIPEGRILISNLQ